MAIAGLKNEGYAPPDARRLRRVLRLYIRSSVRGREAYTVPEMLRHTKDFTKKKWHLAKFILRRLELIRLQ